MDGCLIETFTSLFIGVTSAICLLIIHTCTCLLLEYFCFLSFPSQDGSLIDEVLGTMVKFAEQLSIDDNTRVLALESYTELLDLLDFMLLPGVLRRQAEVLMNLVTFSFCTD